MLYLYLSMIPDDDGKREFERIYLKYYNDVYKRIYYILKNKQDSEDISQETWLKAMRNIQTLRNKSELSVISYIMRIARNEALLLIRQRTKEQVFLCKQEVSEIKDDHDFFESLEHHTVDDILDCIKMLPPIYSDVMVYYYLYENTVPEIAELFGISEDAVRKRISRGRAQLATKLKENW